MKIYNPQLPTELHTDASALGYGAILLQKHNEEWHPVVYLSFKTTPAQSRYSSYELEALAVVIALKKLRVYLLGIPFRVVTDCRAFELTMRKRDICPRVARWALQVGEFNCEVVHRSGSAMRHVDALSRCPVVLQVADGLVEQVKAGQKKDTDCHRIRALLEDGREHQNFELRRDILYRLVGGYHVLVVPRSMQMCVLRNIHQLGHVGAQKMEMTARQEYQIDNLRRRCEQVVSSCVPCILAARKSGKQEGLYNPIDKSGGPMHTYHIDHLGPLPSTARNYRYLFVVVDAFTKFVWIYPVKDTSSAVVVQKLRGQQEVFGSPVRIISDRGTAFTSGEFRDYCGEERIAHVLTTTGVPRGNLSSGTTTQARSSDSSTLLPPGILKRHRSS